MARPPKKSETLEIRLPHETKAAFMARCGQDGVTASQALRGFIETRIAEDSRPPAWRRWAKIAAGAAVALGVAGAALPSLAGPLARTGFDQLDANDNGSLSLAEFAAGARAEVRIEGRVTAPAPDLRRALLDQAFRQADLDGDGGLSPAEYREAP
jgi:hypothetical protein